MELLNGDCLELMKKMEDNSIDLLFCDLPYGQTSCAWDCLIDIELFWKQVKRICKDDTPMVFTCSVKFGNTLINSNPKMFRYDLVWVKSSSAGFLNAKKMPMKKHEMVYVFYKKLPKVYTENIALHHTHKFLKEDKEKYMESDLYGNGGKDTQNKSVRQHKILYKKSEYNPPLPTSVVRDTGDYQNNSDLYGKIDRPDFMRKQGESMYEPALPTSVVKEENVVLKTQHKTAYGNNIHHHNTKQKNGESIYDPPLPTSVVKEDYDSLYGDLKQPDWICDNVERNKLRRKYKKQGDSGSAYDPPLPTSVVKDNTIYRKHKENDYYKQRKSGEGTAYEPPLPNTILEVKSEKGKHSTQKPVGLMKWVLKYYSRENGVVLDPTMGSGSTGVACKEMNRKFIGIEKDEDIFKVAKERLTQ